MSRKKKEGEMESTSTADLDKFLHSLSKEVKSKEEEPVKEFISTGSTLLDYAIANQRNGGIPTCRLTELNGEESSGKSLIAMHVLANTQKKGGIGVYIDTEHSIETNFARRIGVDWDRLIKPNPETIEETFEVIEKIIIMARETFPDKEKPVTIVWDSVASTPPKAEIEGTYDANSRMGVGAKAVSLGMRKLTSTIDKGFVTLLFLNQLRFKMNVMNPYMDPFITPYGKAIPHHASIRIRLASGAKIKDSVDPKVIHGIECRAKTIKSKISPPLREAEFPIMFSNGIDDEQSIYNYLHSVGQIQKARGTSEITFSNGVVSEFKHTDWRDFAAKNRDAVNELLDKLLIRDYDKKSQESKGDYEADGEL
jgi:recombination protein RecA